MKRYTKVSGPIRTLLHKEYKRCQKILDPLLNDVKFKDINLIWHRSLHGNRVGQFSAWSKEISIDPEFHMKTGIGELIHTFRHEVAHLANRGHWDIPKNKDPHGPRFNRLNELIGGTRRANGNNVDQETMPDEMKLELQRAVGMPRQIKQRKSPVVKKYEHYVKKLISLENEEIQLKRKVDRLPKRIKAIRKKVEYYKNKLSNSYDTR